MRALARSKTVWLVGGLFLVLNLVISAVTVPDGAEIHGGDAQSWIGPAKGLVKHGGFVDPDDPANPDLRRGPLYPLLVAGSMLAGGERYARVLVPIQVLILFVTAMIAGRFTEDLLPGYGVAALALVAFNPNALGTAHLVQSETLFAFLVTLLAWATLTYCRTPGVRAATLAGAALGLACLTRPEGQFLVILLPIAFLILPSLPGQTLDWRRRAIAAVASGVIALVAVSPWLMRNHSIGHGARLSSYESISYFMWGSVAQLEMIGSEISEREAEHRIARRRVSFIESQGARWETLPQPERYRRLFFEAVRQLTMVESATLARTVGLATAQFYGAGGAGNFHNLLGMQSSNPYQTSVSGGYSSYWEAWLAAILGGNIRAVAITVVAVGLVVVLRLLGLAGLFTLTRRQEWRVGLVIVSAVAYFAFVYPFYGNSRFRIGIEPLLILLALYGFAGLRETFRRRRAGTVL